MTPQHAPAPSRIPTGILPDDGGRRRRRVLTALPFGCTVGVAAGMAAGSASGYPPGLTGTALAVAFAGFVWVTGLLEQLAVALLGRPGEELEGGVALALDLLVGAVLGRVAAPLLDTSALAAMATFGGCYAAYQFVVEQMVMGGWVDGLGRILSPGGGPPPPQHSRAAALAAQGAWEAALAEYREAIQRDPRDARPYLAMARLLRDDLDRTAEACLWLRRCLLHARLTEDSRALTRREMVATKERLRTELARAEAERTAGRSAGV